MSRWRRKSKDPTAAASEVDGQGEFSDVKIVKREPAPNTDESTEDAADANDDGGSRGAEADPLLAELSEAFSDDDTKETPVPTTIAIGGDDDLPDAVYLDEELGGGDDSEPVFIDDDGTGDAVLPHDATGPGIEPRLRQRRIGVRRAEGRRRLRRWGIVAGVAVVVIAILAVLGSSLFAVDDVDVTGLERADVAAVEAIVNDVLGEPVLLVDTGAVEDRLEQLPYVETARVRTDFPNGATIEIREREPVAFTRGADDRFRIMDREGRIVDVIEGQPVEFVSVTGPTTLDLEAGQYADTGYAAAAAMVTKLTPDVRSRMISISVVADGSDMRFLLDNEPGPVIEVRLGAAITDNDQIERLVRLQRVLDDVEGSDTTVIDVSTAETTER